MDDLPYEIPSEVSSWLNPMGQCTEQGSALGQLIEV